MRAVPWPGSPQKSHIWLCRCGIDWLHWFGQGSSPCPFLRRRLIPASIQGDYLLSQGCQLIDAWLFDINQADLKIIGASSWGFIRCSVLNIFRGLELLEWPVFRWDPRSHVFRHVNVWEKAVRVPFEGGTRYWNNISLEHTRKPKPVPHLELYGLRYGGSSCEVITGSARAPTQCQLKNCLANGVILPRGWLHYFKNVCQIFCLTTEYSVSVWTTNCVNISIWNSV